MWIALTLFCAFCLATTDALTKQALKEGADEMAVGWLRTGLAAPYFIAALLLSGPAPELGPEFGRAFAIALPIELAAFWLYVKALRTSPMSVTVPFLAFTPLYLVAVGALVLGEHVDVMGALGIGLLALGSYALYFHEHRAGFWGPLRAIGRERGARYMLMVSVLYAFTSTLGKVGVTNSTPIFFGSVYTLAVAVAYLPFAARGLSKGVSRRVLVLMALAGLFQASMVFTHMLAISMAKVAYMIALKRTSLLMGVAYGGLLFKEGHMHQRMLGAGLMFMGFVVLVFGAS